MPLRLASPGVYIKEVSSGVRTIIGVATSVAAFLGSAYRGVQAHTCARSEIASSRPRLRNDTLLALRKVET